MGTDKIPAQRKRKLNLVANNIRYINCKKGDSSGTVEIEIADMDGYSSYEVISTTFGPDDEFHKTNREAIDYLKLKVAQSIINSIINDYENAEFTNNFVEFMFRKNER